MNKKLGTIQRVWMITAVIFLSFTLWSEALEVEGSNGEKPMLMMERIRDFLPGDNFNMLEDLRDRVEELSDSIGRGAERIGDSLERLTDFIGFGSDDSEEENQGEAPGEEEEALPSGQVVGTFKNREGEPVENVRVNLGNFATYTDEEGTFQFDDIPYGDYTLSYQVAQGEPLKEIEEILIDEGNQRFVFRLVLDQRNGEGLGGEGETLEEVEVESQSETVPLPEEEEEPEESSNVLWFLGLLFIILLGIGLFFLLNRKHIKVIDGGTGETLSKRKVEIKPVTWIDLSDEFEEASREKIRVRFIRSTIKKLFGSKVIFTVDDEIIAEIPEYSGELDFLVQRTSVQDEEQEDERRETD